MNELTRADRWLGDLLEADAELAAAVDAARALIADGLGEPAPDPAAARVFYGAAPLDALEPFVVYQEASGGPAAGAGVDVGATDVEVIPAVRVLTHAAYTVKAVGPGADFGPLEPIADRLDALLQGAAGNAWPLAADPAAEPADTYVGEVRRTAPVKYPEVADGRPFRHLGGVYRLTLHHL